MNATYSAASYGGSVLAWAKDIVESGDRREEAECIRQLSATLNSLLTAAEIFTRSCHHHPDRHCTHQRALESAIARARGDK